MSKTITVESSKVLPGLHNNVVTKATITQVGKGVYLLKDSEGNYTENIKESTFDKIVKFAEENPVKEPEPVEDPEDNEDPEDDQKLEDDQQDSDMPEQTIEETEKEPEQEPPVDLYKLNLKELKQMATDLEIQSNKNDSKEKIIQLILNKEK